MRREALDLSDSAQLRVVKHIERYGRELEVRLLNVVGEQKGRNDGKASMFTVVEESAPFKSWDARFISVLTLALVVDEFLLNIDLCLPKVVRKVYMRPKSRATGLAYSHKQRIVGRFHHSHPACRNDTPCFLENVPLAVMRGELEPQIFSRGFGVL